MIGKSVNMKSKSNVKPGNTGFHIVPGVLKKIGKRLARVVSNGLFPETCFTCNEFFDTEEYPGKTPAGADLTDLASESAGHIFPAVMARYLCHVCMADFSPVTPPICTQCGIQFKSMAGEDHLCGQCISAEKPFISARACGQHAGALMKLIHAYKYSGNTALGRPFGTLLHIHFLKHYAQTQIDFIIPVPLHKRKLRKRGFDQVAYMLYHWPWLKTGGQRRTDNGSVLADKLLIRVKNTDTQTGLDRKKRAENIKNAFAVTDTDKIRNSRILLIDDVYTTGATLEECALALKRAGASEVYFLTLARAM